MKIQTKLAGLLLVLSIGIVVAAGVFSTLTLDSYFRSRIIEEMKTQANEVEFIARSGNFSSDSIAHAHLRELARTANIRLTLIRNDGIVVFESDLPEERLPSIENHLQRPEVQEAIVTGEFGTHVRRSATLDIDMLYIAKSLSAALPEITFKSAAILRVGIPLTEVKVVMDDIRSKIILTSIGVMLFVIVVTLIVSRRVARPLKEMAAIALEIRNGNFSKRIPIRSHDELGELGEALNNMIEKLNEDIAKLRKLERVRSEFLGNVSHELRTPIFSIQGMLETLLHGALDDESVRKTFVERALHNTIRLNTLLGDLIEISRIESGDMKMSFRYFDLGDFLRQVVAELKELGDRKNIAIRILPHPDNMEVLGDKERLKQVLTNLIDNAIKYTHPGGCVDLIASIESNRVKISVQDTGVGIPDEHLPRLFERFYRVDRERSREAGGTGLGLAIVKHILEAHQSVISVESTVGKGSIFSFTLRR